MKPFLVLMLILLSFSSFGGGKLSDDDKKAHILGSYGLVYTFSHVLEKYEVPLWKRILYSSVATGVIGFSKEQFFDDKYDGKDMLANGIGIGLGVSAVFSVDTFFGSKKKSRPRYKRSR